MGAKSKGIMLSELKTIFSPNYGHDTTFVT